MEYEKKLREIIKNTEGLILTKDIINANIPRQYLKILVEKNELEWVAHGIYVTADTFVDEMYCIQLRSNKIVFSHETALYLHDLTDRDPLVYRVTVPREYGTNRLIASGIVTTTIKKEIYPIGIIKKTTIYGNKVQVYDMERTICDLIKYRNKMDKEMFYIALKRYVDSDEKNLKGLINYARKMRMEKIVRSYMEGLLV